MLKRGSILVCSNCGYENPRGHRFCGMCGTPFPHRSMTVPTAQSTLTFASTPLEITAPLKPGKIAAEPSLAERVTSAEAQVEPIHSAAKHTVQETPELERERRETLEAQVPESTSDQRSNADVVPSQISSVESGRVEIVEPPVRPALQEIFHAETEFPPLVPERSEAASVFTEAEARSEEPPATEFEIPAPPLVHEPEIAAKNAVEEAHGSSPIESQPELPSREPAREPQMPAKARPEPERTERPSPPSAPQPPYVIVPRPKPPITVTPRRSTAGQTVTIPQPKPAFVHRSPDSLPITPPPASAGMPTFQEVADAAGAPPLSPFEQLEQVPAGEDEELKKFVANFRYTPPEETADELTMRSEVPVLDEEAPEEFHHPSFDGDEPPPTEESHPTGQEYYPPPDEAPRPRFLEIDEAATQARRHSSQSTGSLLGLDQPVVATDEIGQTSRRRWWLWSSLAILVAVFAVLGFLEGRAQSTNAFRGPAEWVSMEYASWRDKLKELTASKAPKPSQASTTATESKPDTSAQQPSTPQADTEAQPKASAQPDTESESAAANPAEQTTAQQAQSPPTPNPEPGPATANTATPATGPAKTVEPPPTVRSSRPQPGQQELNNALNASDATAAAAWLWKATSRGNPEAPVRLADMYIRGNGVPKSCEQALVLLRSAAIKENAPARNRLAALYANGTCVARDKVRAYQLMSSALQADPNSEWAKESRQQLWNQMTPSERAMAQKNR
jgi:TPR repeat protein